MPSLFFGPSALQLYGVLEPPAGRPKRTGVLLLYPGVHEYMRAHWAFRSLAAALASRGFAALRFDYRGTGDSAGEPESTTFEACVEDACVAADELRDAGGVDEIVVIGMRLGAAVALHAAVKVPFARRALLWNPILAGRDYLDELAQMDRALRLQLLHPLRHPSGELAGYAFPDEVRRSIERVDLVSAPPAGKPRRVDVFTEEDEALPSMAGLRAALERAGHTVESHGVKGSEPAAFPDAALLAQAAIAALVARVEATAK